MAKLKAKEPKANKPKVDKREAVTPSFHGAIVRPADLAATVSVHVNCPNPIVQANSTHDFKAVAYAQFQNGGAAVSALARLSFIEGGSKLASSPDVQVQIPNGPSDMKPLQLEYTYEFKPGAHTIRTEVTIWDAQSTQGIGSDWRNCESFAT